MTLTHNIILFIFFCVTNTLAQSQVYLEYNLNEGDNTVQLLDSKLKRVILVELTVPWETNIPKDHTFKVNKYYDLTNELTRNRYIVNLYAIEVGARGITAKSLYNLFKDLGLSRTIISSFLERTSKAALSNLRGSEKVHVQLYYEVHCSGCIEFDVTEFAPVVETMSQYLDIQTYPFGNAKIIDDNGKVDFKCQHGPPECYGNKLHACALDKLENITALLYNTCLMNSTDGPGSDDNSADRCGKSMKVDSEAIKDCAKGSRGTELLRYYGEESKKANFKYVPYVLINGKEYQGSDFKTSLCAAFNNPPPACQ